MHTAVWENIPLGSLVVAAVVLLAVWDRRRSLAQARRLRDLENASSVPHSKTFVWQRRVWRFRVWVLIPIGVIIVLGGLLDTASEGHWTWRSVIAPAVGFFIVFTSVSRWRCLRILKKPAQAAPRTDSVEPRQ